MPIHIASFQKTLVALVLGLAFTMTAQAKMKGTHDGKTCVVHFADGTPQGVGCGHGATCNADGTCEVKTVGNPDAQIDNNKIKPSPTEGKNNAPHTHTESDNTPTKGGNKGGSGGLIHATTIRF